MYKNIGMRLVVMTWGLFASVAFAHSSHGVASGFVSGFVHPLLGLDHVVAMVAVGLWGAILGGNYIWMLPVVFPLVMAFGGVLGILLVPIPAVETGIAVSAIVLGLMVCCAVKPPLTVAALVVGTFGIFHGHAHGTELPNASNALTYSIGFVIATGLMHLAGITLGVLPRWPVGRLAVRVGGGAITLTGVGFILGIL